MPICIQFWYYTGNYESLYTQELISFNQSSLWIFSKTFHNSNLHVMSYNWKCVTTNLQYIRAYVVQYILLVWDIDTIDCLTCSSTNYSYNTLSNYVNQLESGDNIDRIDCLTCTFIPQLRNVIDRVLIVHFIQDKFIFC